jgi:hypothetical protein
MLAERVEASPGSTPTATPWPLQRSRPSAGSPLRPRPGPTPRATGPRATSPTSRSRAGAAGRSRVLAATGLGWPAACSEHDEWVVEGCRPKRPASRTGAKTDAADAVRAANQALAPERLAAPRQRGHREALRVLLVTRRGAVAARVDATNQPRGADRGVPAGLRAGLRGRPTAKQIRSCATLRNRPARSLEHRATVRALRATAGAHRAAPGRSRRVPHRDRRARPRCCPVAARAAWCGTHQRRSGAGQLVACRPAALRGGVRDPGRDQSDPSFVWAAHPSPALTGPGTGSSTAPCTPSPKPACAMTH